MSLMQEQVVYVVDDDQGMLDSTVWLLESVGLKALPFTSGRAFLEACDAARPACVLLDVRMPGMGGLNVQEELRARGLDLPVIFVSGHADVPIVVRAFKAGACDFLEKPCNEQQLLDSVQQALRRHAERLARVAVAQQAFSAAAAAVDDARDELGVPRSPDDVRAHRHHRDAACILLAGKVLHLVGTEGGKGQVAFGDMLALDAPAAPLDGGLDIIGLPSPVRRPLPRPCAGDAAKALQ